LARPAVDDPLAKYAAHAVAVASRFGAALPQQQRTRLDAILATVASTQQGQRQALCFWGACKIRDMIADGEAPITAFEALRAAAAQSGLEARRIESAIASATRDT